MSNPEHNDYTFIDSPIHSEQAGQDFLTQFAPLIVAAYRGVLMESVEELTPEQVNHALSAVKQGDRLVYALDGTQKPVGVFAYSVYTPETKSDFYRNVAKEARLTRPEVQKKVGSISRVMVANELAVSRGQQGKNLSGLMRGHALANMSTRLDSTALIGEAQSGHSVNSRLSIPGQTVFGLHLLDSEYNSETDPQTIVEAATTLATGYLRTHDERARRTYSPRTGTYYSGEFDKNLPFPKKTFQEPITAALRAIENRKKRAKQGQVPASVVVTFPR